MEILPKLTFQNHNNGKLSRLNVLLGGSFTDSARSHVKHRVGFNKDHQMKRKLVRNAVDSAPSQIGQSQAKAKHKKVVILGGSGRIGKSTAVQLIELYKEAEFSDAGDYSLQIVIGGRNK